MISKETKINKKEAPRDYMAVENPENSYGCEFCDFNLHIDVFCHLTEMTSFPSGGCSAEYRQDSTNVHFILDENRRFKNDK